MSAVDANREERRTHHTLQELLEILGGYKADTGAWPMGLLHLARQIEYKRDELVRP
jgi:hypothetical protein